MSPNFTLYATYILHYKEILKVVTPGEYMGHVYNISRFRAGQVSRLC